MHVDDLADGCFFLLQNYNEPGLINLGSGIDISIKELAVLIANTIGYNGELYFDNTKPDGTPKKLMDSSRINSLGWHPKIKLEVGINDSIDDFKKILMHETN
jgi:GDP-L-fucose synthase